MLPFWSFRAIRVANEAPLLFYVRNALILQPPHCHRPEDDAGVADSPWPFPAPTRHVHFLSSNAQRDQLSPPRSGSSPLFPMVKTHSTAHPTVEFTRFCEFHSSAVVVHRTSDIRLQFRDHFCRRVSPCPFGDLIRCAHPSGCPADSLSPLRSGSLMRSLNFFRLFSVHHIPARTISNPRKLASRSFTTWLLVWFTVSLSSVDRYLVILCNMRLPTRRLRHRIKKSSAYRTNLCPRFSSWWSNSSSNILANSGLSGPPYGTPSSFSVGSSSRSSRVSFDGMAPAFKYP